MEEGRAKGTHDPDRQHDTTEEIQRKTRMLNRDPSTIEKVDEPNQADVDSGVINEYHKAEQANNEMQSEPGPEEQTPG